MSDSTPPPPGGGNSGGYGGYESAPPPPPPGGDYGYGYGGGAPQPAGTNSKSIWALVLGILGLLCCGFLTGIPAIILGKMSQNEIDRSGGAQKGRGMATAGFILGIIACIFGLIGLIGVLTGAIDTNFYANTSP